MNWITNGNYNNIRRDYLAMVLNYMNIELKGDWRGIFDSPVDFSLTGLGYSKGKASPLIASLSSNFSRRGNVKPRN